MLVTDVGIATLVKELHPSKALALMVVNDVGMSTHSTTYAGGSTCLINVKMYNHNSSGKSGNVSNTALDLYADSITVQTVTRRLKHARRSCPACVSFGGDHQRHSVSLSRDFPSGAAFIVVKDLHPLKASHPMLVTDVGMSTLVKELHPRKAL